MVVLSAVATVEVQLPRHEVEEIACRLVAIWLQLHTIAYARIIQFIVYSDGIDAAAVPFSNSRIEIPGFDEIEHGGVFHVFLVRTALIFDI